MVNPTWEADFRNAIIAQINQREQNGLHQLQEAQLPTERYLTAAEAIVTLGVQALVLYDAAVRQLQAITAMEGRSPDFQQFILLKAAAILAQVDTTITQILDTAMQHTLEEVYRPPAPTAPPVRHITAKPSRPWYERFSAALQDDKATQNLVGGVVYLFVIVSVIFLLYWLMSGVLLDSVWWVWAISLPILAVMSVLWGWGGLIVAVSLLVVMMVAFF